MLVGNNGSNFADKAALVKGLYEKWDTLTTGNKKAISELVAKGDWLINDDKEFKNKLKLAIFSWKQKNTNLGPFDQNLDFKLIRLHPNNLFISPAHRPLCAALIILN